MAEHRLSAVSFVVVIVRANGTLKMLDGKETKVKNILKLYRLCTCWLDSLHSTLAILHMCSLMAGVSRWRQDHKVVQNTIVIALRVALSISNHHVRGNIFRKSRLVTSVSSVCCFLMRADWSCSQANDCRAIGYVAAVYASSRSDWMQRPPYNDLHGWLFTYS
jgi:hypothetical protein